MITVYAIDALEHKLVEEWGCMNLKQTEYGKTDITEFSEPRTMVLWSSFMTGENKEKEVLGEGNEEMWNIKWPREETFFKNFDDPQILDLPGYNYDLEVHEESRQLLKKFFESEGEEKNSVRKQYNQDAFNHHRKIKQEFINALESQSDLVVGYFSLADVIGHLNFGNATMMKMIYQDLDELAAYASERSEHMLVLSDHGMYDLGGGFGDHSGYGYWSTSWKSRLEDPEITDFGEILSEL